MVTVACPRSESKPGRFLKVLKPLDADGTGAQIEMTLPKGKKVEIRRYWVDRVQADFGKAFLFEKEGDPAGLEPNEEYHVHIDDEQHCSCECLGFLRWDHCRHVESLKKLLELGKL